MKCDSRVLRIVTVTLYSGSCHLTSPGFVLLDLLWVERKQEKPREKFINIYSPPLKEILYQISHSYSLVLVLFEKMEMSIPWT